MRMTPEQSRATNPKTTAWVGASAGTGKTHVLTSRFFRLLLSGTAPDKILCLTFTKAAAAEMTNRIFEELGKWASMDDQVLRQSILERTDISADDDVMVRARGLFAAVLDVPGGLKIQTFHSFCQSLLGRFPLEAGLAPGFDSLDEGDAAVVLREARDRMLAKTRDDMNVYEREALDRVVIKTTEMTFDKVMNDLLSKASSIAAATKHHGTEGVKKAIYEAMGVEYGISADALKKSILRSIPLTQVRTAIALFKDGGAKEKVIAEKFVEVAASDDIENLENFDIYASAFMTKANGKAAFLGGKKTLSDNPAIEVMMIDEQDRVYNAYQALQKIEMAENTVALIALGSSQVKEYADLKSYRGMVDFDDMISSTVSLLRRSDVASWVQFKLDGGVHHILVDEAQDTNADQWSVVEALATDFFSGAGAVDQVRTIMSVGDVKQSIFSFQKADPVQFINARDRVFAAAKAAGQKTDPVALNQSFRSGGAVLSVVDSVFNAANPACAGMFEEVEHDFSRKGHAGLVELWPVEERTDVVPDDAFWTAPIARVKEENPQMICAYRVASKIRDMIKGGEILPSKGRAVKPGDIMIIVQSRTPFVEYVTSALKSFDVPVAGRDRMKLMDEMAALDIVKLIKFCLLPEDDLTLAEVLKGPFVGMDDMTLYDIAKNRGKMPLWHRLSHHAGDSQELQSAYDFLKDALSVADKGSPYDFISYILDVKGGRKKLVSRLGNEAYDVIDELQNEALDFEIMTGTSLQMFVQNILAQEKMVKRDMDVSDDCVRILTAHGSKGLQAPIVFLPDTVKQKQTNEIRLVNYKDPKGGPDLTLWRSGTSVAEIDEALSAELAKIQEENNRLMYVALTRAEDNLYITGWKNTDETKAIPDDCWYSHIRRGMDMLEGAVTIEDGDREIIKFEVAQTIPVEMKKEKVRTKSIQVPLPAWSREIAATESPLARPLAPSRQEVVEPAVLSPLKRRKKDVYKRGNIIHTLLQFLPDVKEENREVAAMRYLNDPALGINDDERTDYLSEVNKILTDIQFSEVFSINSRAEVPIVGKLDDKIVSGQVDRLVITEDTVLIVDYKTNRPAPVSVENVPEVYLTQMSLYKKVLEKTYPGKAVKCALLWTNISTLMPLPDDLIA